MITDPTKFSQVGQKNNLDLKTKNPLVPKSGYDDDDKREPIQHSLAGFHADITGDLRSSTNVAWRTFVCMCGTCCEMPKINVRCIWL
uniref:Uncharacterized protein n=1 Tax=Oryza sativa subsp. japonica TaxID=39947 RepID=Q6K8E0_ORYSJ|nr:hypothetical protein [Oryza sativa Japonica Group]